MSLAERLKEEKHNDYTRWIENEAGYIIVPHIGRVGIISCYFSGNHLMIDAGEYGTYSTPSVRVDAVDLETRYNKHLRSKKLDNLLHGNS